MGFVAYLVTADERKLGLQRPVALASVKVGMAYTAAVKLNQALAGGEFLGLLDGVVVDDLERRVRRLDDGGFLDLGDLELGSHCCVWSGDGGVKRRRERRELFI